MPLEYPGIYVSYPTDTTIQIDSILVLVFSPDSKIDVPGQRKIINKRIVSIDGLNLAADQNSDYLKISKNMISIFRKYGVSFISRVAYNFSYHDTIPKLVWIPTKKDSILIKNRNENRILFLRFNSENNTNDIINDLLKIKCIDEVSPNLRVRTKQEEFYREKYKLPYN